MEKAAKDATEACSPRAFRVHSPPRSSSLVAFPTDGARAVVPPDHDASRPSHRAPAHCGASRPRPSEPTKGLPGTTTEHWYSSKEGTVTKPSRAEEATATASPANVSVAVRL